MILDRIIARKRESLAAAKSNAPLAELRAVIAGMPPARPFSAALARTPNSLALIAELKKASPSKGLIRADFDPAKFAAIYQHHGAACISVLTEEDFFQGALENLSIARRSCDLPLLRKDFIFDPYQIYEARANNADAVLLIVAALERSLLEDLIGLAAETGLETLVEAHDAKELDTALSVGARLVGINNRNLKTLGIDLETTIRLLPDIPEDRVVVAESGIGSRADVERLLATRTAAMLVGTSIVKTPNPGDKIDELLGKNLPVKQGGEA
ncbi:MAG: indole-3-glycerol phosphate synthase TrpC [Nitrospirae bacterium]|nr:indole-3-glycerol phosphate synthase TrpC [Nitrospirota bacterium]